MQLCLVIFLTKIAVELLCGKLIVESFPSRFVCLILVVAVLSNVFEKVIYKFILKLKTLIEII